MRIPHLTFATLSVGLLSGCLALLTAGCGINAVKNTRLKVYPPVAHSEVFLTVSHKAMIEESVQFVDDMLNRHGMKLTMETQLQIQKQFLTDSNSLNGEMYRHYGISPGTEVECKVWIIPRKGRVLLNLYEPGSWSGSHEFKAIYRDLATNLVEHFGTGRVDLDY